MRPRPAAAFGLLAALAAFTMSACAHPRAPAPAPPAKLETAWLPAAVPPSPAPTVAPAAPPEAAAPASPALDGKDFADEARVLYRVAACAGDDPIPRRLDAAVVRAHCAELDRFKEAYRARYLRELAPFFRTAIPAGLPDPVVYPFSGGDLLSALATFPDAHEITTISLELAGDPRRVDELSSERLDESLSELRAQVAELLLGENYSRSETLKHTQRGEIPGELAFFLIALAVHGFEPTSLRYFTLKPDGEIHYLTDIEIRAGLDDVAAQRKSTWVPPDFAEVFANAELRFRKVGAPADEPRRVHRHIAQNLSDAGLAHDCALLRHLERKGHVRAMTKAASYLLWNEGFSAIRGYLTGHLDLMVSDSTGIPPAFATEAGLVQETYGHFARSLLKAPERHNAAFRKLWREQPVRPLGFRYGYLDHRKQAHLLLTKRPPTAAPTPTTTTTPGTTAP